ncbi:MAG TPA: hypothetical protein VD999_04540 [Vitreimonas sp.]|nr:hypothetical protein [Vitreimonas sp.]
MFLGNKLLAWVTKNWALALLVCFLMAICVANLKPSFYLMGWDNFSVSLDLRLNLPRTFFATWREYRGFGVASDSEVVDVFRQMILLALDLLLPINLVEQIYYLMMFSLGGIGAFLLVKHVISSSYDTGRPHIIQTSSLIGALFYISSVNTLDVFYLPIVMYIVRFALFPWIVFVFLSLLSSPKLNKGLLLLFAIITLFGTPAYLTATIFITLIILLGTTLFSCPEKIVRYFLLISIFLLLNTFWLLPFINYTVNKSDRIAQSATFSLINEGLLNQFAERFAPGRILSFSAEIFAGMPFSFLDSGKFFEIHDGVHYTQINNPVPYYLFLPLLLALAGLTILIITSVVKKSPKLIWVVLLFSVATFFLFKEYQSLGFLFDSLSQYVPVVKIIFRFAGTKFYILLTMAFMLLIAITVFWLLNFIHDSTPSSFKKVLQWLFSAWLIVAISWSTFFYLQGKLTFDLLFVDLPAPYHEIAETINNDPTFARVVHLPSNQLNYWKVYEWGYYGSAFLNFMLDKPLIDKTFSPASLENDQFYSALEDLNKNFTNLTAQDQKARAQQVYSLFHTAGVKYVINDETVDISNLTAKNIKTWDYSQTFDMTPLVIKMKEEGLLQEIIKRNINITEFTQKYGLIPEQVGQNAHQDRAITLFALSNFETSSVRSVPSVTNYDANMENALLSLATDDEQTFTQNEKAEAGYLPFLTTHKNVTKQKDHWEFGNPSNTPLEFAFNTATVSAKNVSEAYDIFLQKNDKNLTIFAQRTQLPFEKKFRPEAAKELLVVPMTRLNWKQIQKGAFTNQYANDWHMLGLRPVSNYRLQIGDLVLPIPMDVYEQPSYLSTILSSSETNISILEHDQKDEAAAALKLDTLGFLPEPNCYPDKKSSFETSIDANENNLVWKTKDGTSCLSLPLGFEVNQADAEGFQSYLELTLTTTHQTTESEIENQQFSPLKIQRAIRGEVADLPNYTSLEYCFADSDDQRCLNYRQALRTLSKESTVTITSQRTLNQPNGYVTLILPRINEEEHTVNISQLALNTFSPLVTTNVTLPSAINTGTRPKITSALSLPYVLSTSSYFFNPQVEALQLRFRSSCEHGSGDHRLQRVRMAKEGTNNSVLSYVDDCYQSIFTVIPFNPHNLYFLGTQYHVYTGNQPQWIASQDYALKHELLSRYDYYPNMPNFKTLQHADRFLSTVSSAREEVKKELNKYASLAAYTTVQPVGNTLTKDQFIEIHHPVGNQGLMQLWDLTIMALPASWGSVKLTPPNPEQRFDEVQVKTITRVLPSLWKAEIELPREWKYGRAFLEFGQAYDQQWQFFVARSPWQVFFNKGHLPVEPVKVNGWANGFIIAKEQLPTTNSSLTVYFFYIPERLAIVGWMITITTVMAVILYCEWAKLKALFRFKR